jgi:hypothetical protein
MRPPDPGEQTLVRLSCLGDDAQGRRRPSSGRRLWGKEVDAREIGGKHPSRGTRDPFDE